jgi:hypothetical protein
MRPFMIVPVIALLLGLADFLPADDPIFSGPQVGEKLGIYRDYPVSKGCTSPFAPIWINAMVSR